jgi:hypothetical protein
MKQKTYIARYPQNFGLRPEFKLIFKRTENGYCAKLSSDKWIGMPTSLIERSPQLFNKINK